MYIPYFRGKQFDLLALKECVNDGLLSKDIVPLIEPVRDSIHLRSTIEAFIQKEHEILIIDNPEVGQVQKGVTWINDYRDLLESSFVTPAYILNDGFMPGWVGGGEFVFLSKNYSKSAFARLVELHQPKFHIIADSARLRQAVTGERVLLTDPFTRLKHGADYLELTDEFFTDEYKYYREEGYIGFSNYGIDGETYYDKGFPTRTVVLHVLYIDLHGSLRIKHFASDSNESAANPKEKFIEALTKAYEWYERHKEHLILTQGTKILLAYLDSGKFPGAGTIKKLLVMHGLELIKHAVAITSEFVSEQ